MAMTPPNGEAEQNHTTDVLNMILPEHLPVLVLAACLTAGSGSSTTTRSTGPAAKDSGSHAAAGSVGGSLDDWRSAVSQVGTYTEKNEFRNATAGAFCGAKSGAGPIVMGQWTDNLLMVNDLGAFRGGYYASCNNGQLITDFVAACVNGSPALQPLTQFGFTVQPVSAAR